MDAHQKRIEELVKEHVDIVPYDPEWPEIYASEEAQLHKLIPGDLVIRIDHIGSTAIPGCTAKPIIDVQVEVHDLERVRKEVVPRMEKEGYEFIWRPTMGERAPFYAWFIKRDKEGIRTHHIHVVEPDQASADRILFRDQLRGDPDAVQRYEALKLGLAVQHPNDRTAYTLGKSNFVNAIVEQAKAS